MVRSSWISWACSCSLFRFSFLSCSLFILFSFSCLSNSSLSLRRFSNASSWSLSLFSCSASLCRDCCSTSSRPVAFILGEEVALVLRRVSVLVLGVTSAHFLA
eukprot:Lithocolla_globosa_v1_NODE_534_length_3801_cov_4.912974.p4 type:complete len:103 gc:universal NODE_534_length_3801_cov_4.912974:1274-966(-)